MMSEAVTDEVRALADLDLFALREAWRARFGCPPKLRSAELVRRVLAWRIQEAALGGLDADTRRMLRRKSERPRSTTTLKPGTRIAREWQGRVHEVEITSEGVLYDGRTFRSLSAVALVISGTRWNGPRFFGLREAANA
jgi:hypothetical protein